MLSTAAISRYETEGFLFPFRAFTGEAPVHLVQIDAHLDFVDERHGVRHGHGNPMRRGTKRRRMTVR